MSKINLILLDYDGCLFAQTNNHVVAQTSLRNAFYANPIDQHDVGSKKLILENELCGEDKPTTDPQQLLFKKIKTNIEKSDYKKIIVGFGTNRQDWQTEHFNATSASKKVGYSTLDMPLVQSHLARQYKDKKTLNGEKIECVFDSFLMSDLYTQQADGATFKNNLRMLTDNKDKTAFEARAEEKAKKGPTWIHDENKISLIYAHAHRVKLEHPNDQINIDFYDDRIDILNEIKYFFKNYPFLLPRGVTLNLHHHMIEVNQNTPSFKMDLIIEGEGDVNPNYDDSLFKLTFKNTKENNESYFFMNSDENPWNKKIKNSQSSASFKQNVVQMFRSEDASKKPDLYIKPESLTGCEIFLMSNNTNILTSDRNHLYLYKSISRLDDGTEVKAYYYKLFGDCNYYLINQKENIDILNFQAFDQHAGHPVAWAEKDSYKCILEETSKRGHTNAKSEETELKQIFQPTAQAKTELKKIDELKSPYTTAEAVFNEAINHRKGIIPLLTDYLTARQQKQRKEGYFNFFRGLVGFHANDKISAVNRLLALYRADQNTLTRLSDKFTDREFEALQTGELGKRVAQLRDSKLLPSAYIERENYYNERKKRANLYVEEFQDSLNSPILGK